MRHASHPSQVCKADPRATPVHDKRGARCSARIPVQRQGRPTASRACPRDAQWDVAGDLHCTNHAAEALRKKDLAR